MSIIFKKSIVAILIFALALPYGFLAFPKKAEAVVPVAEVPGALLTATVDIAANTTAIEATSVEIAATSAANAMQNTMQTGLQTGLLGVETLSGQYVASLHQKEVGPVPFVPFGSWDQLANNLTKMMIGTLTNTMVNWIQTGGMYPGGGTGSLFVNDILRYMTSVADSAAGKFLEQVLDPKIFNLLCTNWRNQFANLLQRTSRPQLPYFQRARCTITDILNNFGANVDLYSPYAANTYWQQIRSPQNNIYDSFLSAYYARSALTERRVYTAQSELSFGQGFLSFKTKDGKIATPGSVIEEQLATQLGSGVRSLEVADELNEIIAAIVSRLITEILTTPGKGIGGWTADSSLIWKDFILSSKPDLVVSKTLAYSPLNPQSGQVMSLKGDIVNVGPVVAGAFKAELKIDPENAGGAGGSPENEVKWDISVGPIQPGETKSVNWQNVWTAVSGSHKFRICADVQNSIDESNESDNCSETIFQVPELVGLRPDLVVESADFSPQVPGAGELMTFSGKVKNTGTTAGASMTRLRIDVNNNGSWDIIKIADTGPLISGAAETETWPGAWLAILGAHKFEICADFDNRINEGNENNNCVSRVFEVIKKPDLIVSSTSFSPQYPSLNNYMTFSGIIKNQGDATSTLSQARLRIDLGNDNINWIIISPEQSVSGLAPAGTATTTWPAWRASYPGPSAFEICADSGNSANESNEQNNCAGQTFYVYPFSY